jgi:D-alanine transaminase
MSTRTDIVYLNGEFLPMEQAKLSPMDRGFLFGDGIYEVIPSYFGQLVGFNGHMQRMQEGLTAIGIDFSAISLNWFEMVKRLIEENGRDNLGIYVHVSRGADVKRFHAFPVNVQPTVFAFAFEIPPEPVADKTKAKQFSVQTEQDTRWRHCDIKSTSLLGNVMHFQHGQEAGVDETLLYNEQQELTEASACNVFVVKAKTVITPPLDKQLLPGITRHILLDILRKHSALTVEERAISMNEVRSADEVWLTSSSKEIVPVTKIDALPVGDGQIGDIWQQAQALFTQYKYEY